MPPSIAVHDKRSEVPDDSRHQVKKNSTTSVSAMQDKSSNNGSGVASLNDNRIRSAKNLKLPKFSNDLPTYRASLVMIPPTPGGEASGDSVSNLYSNNAAACNGQIESGVNRLKFEGCDSLKKKKNLKSKAISISEALGSSRKSYKITDGSYSKANSCTNNSLASQITVKPDMVNSLVSNLTVKPAQPIAQSQPSMVPSGFLDSSYRRAVRSAEDDYMTDIVSAQNISYRMPGEHKTVSSRSMTQKSEHETCDAIGQNHFVNEYSSQQNDKQYIPPPPKPLRLYSDGDEELSTSQSVQFPQKQVCIPLPTTKISESFQQPKKEEFRSTEEALYDEPVFKVQHDDALPSSSYSRPYESPKITSDESVDDQDQVDTPLIVRDKPSQISLIEKQSLIGSPLTVQDAPSQTDLTIAAHPTKRTKVRSEIQEIETRSKSLDAILEMSSKSADLPKIVALLKKAPSARSPIVSPVPGKNINKISPTLLRRFERTNSGNSKKSRTLNKRPSKRYTAFSPQMCLRNVCPCPNCSQSVSMLESALLYHTGNSPHARTAPAVMASHLNQYIEAIFSALDTNKNGFISVEQFAAVMKTLGCETPFPIDKRMKMSSGDFSKHLWQCWNLNHYQTTPLDKPKTSRPLLESILKSKSDIENIENLSEQLEDINTSMKSAGSSSSFDSTNIGQGLGQRMWQNKQRDLARSKENRYLKSTLKDLRSGLLRLGVENVILKVKLQLESSGNNCCSAPIEQTSSVNSDCTHSEQSSAEECSKCRNNKGSTEQIFTDSNDGSETKIQTDSSGEKSKQTSSDDDDQNPHYLPMNLCSFRKATVTKESFEIKAGSSSQGVHAQSHSPMYQNCSGPYYEENPIYCTIDQPNDGYYECFPNNWPISLGDSDKEEEVTSFESDIESPPTLLRSYGSKRSTTSLRKSKTRLSYTPRSIRSSRYRRTPMIAKPRIECPPPIPLPLPRRSFGNQSMTLQSQGPPRTPTHLSTPVTGMASGGIATAKPQVTSTPLPKMMAIPPMKIPADDLQVAEIRIGNKHKYTPAQPASRTSMASSRSTSRSSTENSGTSGSSNDQFKVPDTPRPRHTFSGDRALYQSYRQLQGTVKPVHDTNGESVLRSCVDVPERPKTYGVDSVDFGYHHEAPALSQSVSNTPRKAGRDQKQPKKSLPGKSRVRALPELLATRTLLQEALSAVRGQGRSSAAEEANDEIHLNEKPRCDIAALPTETSFMENGDILSSSCLQMGQKHSISKEEDESNVTNLTSREDANLGVEEVEPSEVGKPEAFKTLVSTIESSLLTVSGKRRYHNPRGSSRRRDRNVRLPVITENVEVKPNVRLSLKLYEDLRRGNLRISEDSSDEALATEHSDLTVDDILAEVMTYCRENDVPVKENQFNNCDFKEVRNEFGTIPTRLEPVFASESDTEVSVNSKSCSEYNQNSSLDRSENVIGENWKEQLCQQSPLSSNAPYATSITASDCPTSCICCDHTLGHTPYSGDGFDTELEGCTQVEGRVDEGQEDEGSVVLEDGCSSSCSSGSDSGRGESETSCPTPEEHLSCNSGGSDDGMWAGEDYSCLNHMISGSECHRQTGSYPVEQSTSDITRTTATPQVKENPEHLTSIARSVDAAEECSTRYESHQEAATCFDEETLLEVSQYDNHQGESRKQGPLKFKELDDCIPTSVPKQSDNLATLFEDYDNVENSPNTETPSVEEEPELEIIDLDDEPSPQEQKITREGESSKPKRFFGRRCTSFNTFKSFISSTTSHLKRNGPHRSSFSSSKSLPNYFSVTKEVPDLAAYSGPQLKSIFKSNTGTNLKRNSSKRISFSDTINVYPEGSTVPVNADGKRCYRYPAGLEIPEYSPRTNLAISNEADKHKRQCENQQDEGLNLQNEHKNAKHRNEIGNFNQLDDNSTNESVKLSSRNSLELNDILLSLSEFNKEVTKTNSLTSKPVKTVVNCQEISNPVTEDTKAQKVETTQQIHHHSFGRFPEVTMKSSSSNLSDHSYAGLGSQNRCDDVMQSSELTISPAAKRSFVTKSVKPSVKSSGTLSATPSITLSATPSITLSETASEGPVSGQALLEALELELEDVLRSLEDEETDFE